MSERPTDLELWRRAAAGQAAAFGALYDHARPVYNHCFRRTASWAQAEDLTSAVFLEAWRRREEVRFSGDSLLPWLLGVAANLLRNQRRALRRFRVALARLPPPAAEDDFADDVARRLDDERTMRRVLGVIGELPAKEREVLALCAWDGLSYEAAAIALGIPVGTVRSRLARARARLRAVAPRLAEARPDEVTPRPE